ncbi:MAG: hypothetical protein HYV18_09795, partial [Gammaproteobacteria bacterium]|nr:hypothetical protein [Gammaproteobacteria bacterium]
MSLLLDALRRAERERQRGSAVDLAHLTGMPAPAARGPRRLALGAAVVLAGAGALALGLHLRPERAPAPAPSPTLPVQAVPLAAAPAQALPEPPRAAPVVAVGDVVSLDDVIAAPTE